MKKILQNKLILVSALLFGALVLVLKFTNIAGGFLPNLSGGGGAGECVQVLAEDLQDTRYKFTLAGVPAETVDKALAEMISKSCLCIANAAGSSDVQKFIEDKNNAKTIRGCTEKATGTALGKYASI